MRKKYLSALLFGALLFASTGTFTSCKDYDDDINNLQEQISGQEGVSAKITAIESTISSLQSAQSGLQSAIDAAESAAQQAALAAQNAAIEAAKADLEAAKAELQAAATADKEELQAAIATVNETLAGISGSIQTLEQFKTNTEASLEALAQADTNLQNAITDLEASVAENAKQIAANKTAIEGQLAALDEYKALTGADIDALKASIEAIEAGQLTEEMANKIAEQVTETVGAELDLISAAYSKMVTHVEVLGYDEGEYSDPIIAGFYNRMDLRTAEAVEDRVFGGAEQADEKEAALYEIKNQIEFKKGERAFLTDSVLIRVSPSNATLTADQISFINSELGNLDELVTVTDVKPYKGMVTRGVSSNGLWKVYFKLNETNYSEDAYMKAAKYKYDNTLSQTAIDNLAEIKYAVAIKDTPAEQERYVTSGYDLYLASDYAPVYELRFKVDDKNVSTIYNRFHHAEQNNGSDWVLNGDNDLMYDYKWNTNREGDERILQNGSYTSIDADYKSGTATILGSRQDLWNGGDNREDYDYFSAEVGVPFTVELGDYTTDQQSGIYGFYVVLDAQRAVESAPSEINAWNSYEANITGLNTITTNGKLTMSINDEKANGDIIGFRVYAVNHDGSLVDPDGKAFYVAVGEFEATTLATTYTPDYDPTTKAVSREAKVITIDNELKALFEQGCDIDYTEDIDNNPIVDGVQGTFSYEFLDKDGNVTYNKADAVSIRWVADNAAYNYADNETYTIFVDIKNRNNMIVKKYVVEITKTMPGFPERFTPKDNQFIDGVHTTVDAYTLNNWYNPYDFTEAFNGLVDVEGTSASDGNYDFKCATDGILIKRVWNGTEYRYQIEFDYSVLTQNEIFELIGGTYDINVSYTYPRISSESDDHNYTVSGESFKVKLDNDEVLSADWLRLNADKSPVKFNLTYGQNNSQLTIGSDAATCWINIKKDGDAYNFSPAMIGYEAVKEGEIHLISNNGGVDEYFTVEFNEATNAFVFTPVVGALRPAEDVNSTLQFVLVDAFGHEHPVSLANFVVKAQ
ncbi:hypothetical protein [Bacteroides sp. An51A]|uniref:hypothetical protein n=1 Tax=Bacteroides sp. An51A TaxID=1965640 RepID=UPI000B3A2289|nr:hypothetical protein [Bacteroides sp. An51A]OUN81635.1 hypothetical protein B5G04_05035 [Bacteroides sp. An51A]